MHIYIQAIMCIRLLLLLLLKVVRRCRLPFLFLFGETRIRPLPFAQSYFPIHGTAPNKSNRNKKSIV